MSAEQRAQFLVLGKAVLLEFGEQEFVVARDFERAGSAALDRDGDAVGLLELVSRTECLGLVVSGRAEFDLDRLAHRVSPWVLVNYGPSAVGRASTAEACGTQPYRDDRGHDTGTHH